MEACVCNLSKTQSHLANCHKGKTYKKCKGMDESDEPGFGGGGKAQQHTF